MIRQQETIPAYIKHAHCITHKVCTNPLLNRSFWGVF